MNKANELREMGLDSSSLAARNESESKCLGLQPHELVNRKKRFFVLAVPAICIQKLFYALQSANNTK